MTTPTYSTLTRIDELEAIAPEWDALVRSAARPSPFQLSGWLVPWWRELGDGAELAIEVARRDGELVGALPLVVRSRAGLRVGSFVGGPLAEISDLLLAPGEPPETAAALSARADADVFHVLGLPARSVLAAAVAPEPVQTIVRAEAPVMQLTAPWDELVKTRLSSEQRKTMRKRLRKLDEAGRAERKVVSDPDELESVLEEAFGVHEARWAGRPDRSGFVTPAGKRFHRQALRSLAPSGVPRMATVRLDGKLIAYYYWLALDGRACGADMAYLPDYHAFSPGWLATLRMVEEAAAAPAAKEVEFLGGRESYKLTLADGFAPLHEAFARPRTAAARLYVLGKVGAVQLRRRLKDTPAARRFYYDGLAPARRAVTRLRRATTEV